MIKKSYEKIFKKDVSFGRISEAEFQNQLMFTCYTNSHLGVSPLSCV